MILLYGMPTLIAQGLLFVGFVYILSYAIRFLEHLIRKNKETFCNDLSIYSASEIIYDDRVYKLHRIEDLSHIEGYNATLSFDNWINESGMNNRQSSLGTTNKRVL